MSRDGRTIAYLQLPDYRAAQGELYFMPLRRDAKPEATHITAGRGSEFTFSDDGSRIAVIDSECNVTAYETASKKALGSARIPNAAHTRRRLFFVTPDLVRLYIQGPQYPPMKKSDQRIDIYQFDLRTRSLAQTGQFGIATKKLGFVVSADGARALIVNDDDSGNSEARVIDARTAELIETVPAAGLGHTTLLADGSVATLTNDGSGQWTLNAGSRAIAVGKTPRLYFIRELSGGRIVLGSGPKGDPTMYVVDYAHGSVLRSERDIFSMPFSFVQWSGADPRRVVADASQPLAVFGRKPMLYSWQPLTGAKKEMLKL
jgi:DNA-binding beta-propeller fold protein YncE